MVALVLNGPRITRLRWAAGLTTNQLAARAGFSSSTLTAIERGESAGSPATAVALADVLDCSVDDLLDPALDAPYVIRTAEATVGFETPDEALAWLEEHRTTPFVATTGGAE